MIAPHLAAAINAAVRNGAAKAGHAVADKPAAASTLRLVSAR
jgi:hypothetical protein